MKKYLQILTVAFFAVLFLIVSAKAQTTEFTYQGRLTDSNPPQNASYDFEFRLFAVETGGTALVTQQRLGVPVSGGVFSVLLDFGAQFNGLPRWLEIAVKPAGGGTFSVLAPRQRLTSVPHAIRSLNSASADNLSANCTGCVSDANIGSLAGGKITGEIPVGSVPAGSVNYIRNSGAQQTGADFNISGTGTASILNATTQFNIGVDRMLAKGSSSIFAGRLAGVSDIAGSGNSFFGASAGRFNTHGSNNSFFGRDAGLNSTGGNNSFFGAFSGDANTTGNSNSFFGFQAGDDNTTGGGNSFFGRSAGASSTDGNYNAFFGYEAGMSNDNVIGENSFFGAFAGRSNTTGLFNSFFGYAAGLSNTTGEKNSFFGWNAGRNNTAGGNSFFGMNVGVANTTGAANSFFGESAGEDNTTGSRNTFVGRWAGNSNTTGGDNVFIGFNSGLLNKTGTKNVFIGLFSGSFNDGDNLTLIGSNTGVPSGQTLQYATAIGADAEVSTSNTVQLGRANGFDTVFVPGLIRVNGLGVAGSTALCRNASNIIAACSSSLRYKTDVRAFNSGLNIVRRLRPITFNWIDGDLRDVGFGAEDVGAVEPLLVTRNDNGEIEGVKYAQITTVLVNAVKEQQQIIEQQQQQIEALKKLVCRTNAQAEICSEKKKKE